MTEGLRALLASVPQQGTLTYIGLRPKRLAPVESVSEVLAVAGRGLEGDRYARKSGKRQVSLIQAEHLPVIASLLGHEVAPQTLRRNLVIAGIPLRALIRLRFRIGEVVFEGSGSCDPCSRMEEALGEGGYAAMQGMGGILARVIEGGRIAVGDPVLSLGHPD